MSRFFGLALSSALVLLCGIVQAAELMVNGEGSAPMSPNLALTRDASLLAAKRDAVLQAIRKINGPEAGSDPKVLGVLDDIAKQVGPEYVFDQSTRADAANNLVTSLKLKLDDKEFRKLLGDTGIGVKTQNSYPILIVMDEFFTKPTDSQKPLREVVEFFSDKSAHVVASAAGASSSYANSSDSSSSSSASAAVGRQAVSGYNPYNGASINASAGINARSASQSESSSQSQSASNDSYQQNIDAGQKDVQSFKKLVEYQPQNVGPSAKSYTYEAILREAASYDLNVIDNSMFRSQYFTGKALTLDELQAGPELKRYVDAARDGANADYFMMGSSIIYDMDKDPATGQYRCDGVVTVKAFSTAEGKVLATDARTESASGNSPDQCRVNVANKLAVFTGSVLGTQIAEYWKNRNMYGQQFNVKLVSLLGQLNFNLKRNFGKTLEGLRGVKEVPAQRGSTAAEVEYSLQYAGEVPIGDAIGELIATSQAFAAYPNFDIATKGTNVRICLEASCPP
jgi:hypothetical protein